MVLQYLSKALFRLLHITSACIVIGSIITDLFWTERSETSYIVLQITSGVILLISGVVNIILLAPSKIFNHEDKKVWNGLVYTKFALWFFFLHIPEAIFGLFGHSFPRNEFNFILALLMLFISVAAKVFRDAASRKEEDILKSIE